VSKGDQNPDLASATPSKHFGLTKIYNLYRGWSGRVD
jgi:hypothetical protein